MMSIESKAPERFLPRNRQLDRYANLQLRMEEAAHREADGDQTRRSGRFVPAVRSGAGRNLRRVFQLTASMPRSGRVDALAGVVHHAGSKQSRNGSVPFGGRRIFPHPADTAEWNVPKRRNRGLIPHCPEPCRRGRRASHAQRPDDPTGWRCRLNQVAAPLFQNLPVNKSNAYRWISQLLYVMGTSSSLTPKCAGSSH